MQFHRYSEVIVTVDDKTICCRMKSYISAHLEHLIYEFKQYFPDVVSEDTLLIRNPFRCEVKNAQFDMQDEFINVEADLRCALTNFIYLYNIYSSLFTNKYALMR